jgi:hypothetical protein
MSERDTVLLVGKLQEDLRKADLELLNLKNAVADKLHYDMKSLLEGTQE